MEDSLAGPEALLTMGQQYEAPQEESGKLEKPYSQQTTECVVGVHTAELQTDQCGRIPRRQNPEISGEEEADASSPRGLSGFNGDESDQVPTEGVVATCVRIENATVSREWICPVYEHLLSASSPQTWEGSSESGCPDVSERPIGKPELQETAGACCKPQTSLEEGAPAYIPAASSSLGSRSSQALVQFQSENDTRGRLGCSDGCFYQQHSEISELPGDTEEVLDLNLQGGQEEADAPPKPFGISETRDFTEGPRRPCLVLLDLDNTLIPTGWIMACWRKMQVYFGLQQAVACIRKGLEQAELVGALRALFDDLRILRERRHTQIVIVTNAGLRTVQEFYLKMCLPELKELCEREKVYIHSTEHFARRVGPIPPMTEEEAFCEFYTALKYHEFDFVVQRYLNALLCQAPIPLQGASQQEEGASPSAAQSCDPEHSVQLEASSIPSRRSAPPFCKRARLSTQRELSAAQSAPDCDSRSNSAGGCYDWCTRDAGTTNGSTRESAAAEGPLVGGPPYPPPKAKEASVEPGTPASAQQQGEPCCCCSSARTPTDMTDKKQSVPLSLREQLQAAAVAHAHAESERKDTSPAPSPSESPRGFDPFPLDWRCDLISAGDQVCEIHAACRVARHFAGHVKFAKLLFLRDPEDPRFLAQTPTRFIAQLKELHASLLHVISCDEETLDERGNPRWVRRGSFSQVTIVAPERLEAPPRHCAAARVRHAFEFLRKRCTKTSKTATSAPRMRQDLTMQAGFGGDQPGPGQAAELTATARHILSCPLEWERNAVANPPSTPQLRALNESVTSAPSGQNHRDGLDSGQLAVASESKSA